MTDNKSNKTVKNNFDDYGTVSTNKMDITELDINNTNELESLCQQLLSTNHFERQITTWEGADDDLYNKINPREPESQTDFNFDFDFDFDYQNNNWTTEKINTNDEKMLVTELEDENQMCKTIIKEITQCIEKNK
jgi:hypothetical protein